MDEEEAPRGAGGQPSPSPSGWKPMSKAAALALISKVSREAKEEGGTDRDFSQPTRDHHRGGARTTELGGKAGGRGREVVCIVVPYRDRVSDLRRFLFSEKALSSYLESIGGVPVPVCVDEDEESDGERRDRGFTKTQSGLFEFVILVVVQTNNQPFNRGLLINCGALAVKSLCRNGWHLRKGTGCGCEWGREDEKKTEKEEGEQGDLLLRLTTIVTHDVDTLPRGRQWEFTHTGGQCRQYWGTRAGEVRHLYGHSHSLGGTVAVSWEDFVRCNGFSNDLWGWGWEDVDFFRRVVGRGLSVDRGGFVERILVQKGEGRGRRALPCPFEESGGQEIEESVESEMGVDAGKYIGTERSWKGEGSDRRACEGETRGRQFASLFDKVKTGEAKRNERLCESKKGSVSEGLSTIVGALQRKELHLDLMAGTSLLSEPSSTAKGKEDLETSGVERDGGFGHSGLPLSGSQPSSSSSSSVTMHRTPHTSDSSSVEVMKIKEMFRRECEMQFETEDQVPESHPDPRKEVSGSFAEDHKRNRVGSLAERTLGSARVSVYKKLSCLAFMICRWNPDAFVQV